MVPPRIAIEVPGRWAAIAFLTAARIVGIFSEPSSSIAMMSSSLLSRASARLISSSRCSAASWRGDNARSFAFGFSSSIFALRIRIRVLLPVLSAITPRADEDDGRAPGRWMFARPPVRYRIHSVVSLRQVAHSRPPHESMIGRIRPSDRPPKSVRGGVPRAFVAIYAAAGTARGRRIGRLTMTEPTGGPPSQHPPQTPPPQAPASPPAGGNWAAPPPATAPGGFQTAAVEAGPAPGVAYADTTMRVVAYIIDAIIYGIIFFIVFAIIGSLLLGSLLTGSAIVALIAALLLAAVSLIGSAFYFVYTWTTMRASPGQKVLSLETVNAGDGSTLTRDQAIRRWAFLFGPTALALPIQMALTATSLSFLSSLVSLAVLIYEIYLLYSVTQSPKRQGFHDVQATTVVIKRS